MNSIHPKPETALRNMWNVPHLMLNVPQAIPGSSRLLGKCSRKGEFQMTSDPQPSLSIFQWKNNHAIECQNQRLLGHWNPREKLLSNPDVFRKCARRWPWIFVQAISMDEWVQKFGPFPADKTLHHKKNTSNIQKRFRNPFQVLGCPTKK